MAIRRAPPGRRRTSIERAAIAASQNVYHASAFGHRALRLSRIRSLQDAHRASDARTAEVVGHADAGIFDLVGMEAAQLQDGLIKLSHASGADRMSLRQQSA